MIFELLTVEVAIVDVEMLDEFTVEDAIELVVMLLSVTDTVFIFDVAMVDDAIEEFVIVLSVVVACVIILFVDVL